MKIKSSQVTPDVINHIHELYKSNPSISRRALARSVCETFNWRSRSGLLRLANCRKIIKELEKQGILNLPKVKAAVSTGKKPKKNPVSFDITPFEGELSELGEVELILVSGAQSKYGKIWQSMMDEHHYLKSGPLFGAQVKYLFRSATHGWLGAICFSSPAWRLASRDVWIGWSDEARLNHLEDIVCNSRFLILPQIKVKNLASNLLARALKAMPSDWSNRYRYRPVLVETFVEQARFRGTCYRASNWQHVGQTRGIGRQGGNKVSLPIKDVYLYPLCPDWRERLEGDEEVLLKLQEEEASKGWAEREFEGATFGDTRLTARLCTIANSFYHMPQANIPQASGSRDAAKATYRFFDNREVTFNKVIRPHYIESARRSGEHPIILAAQDSTSTNYSTHPATTGLGSIGTKKSGAQGLNIHDTMAFTPAGVPLGLLDVQVWARKDSDDPLDPNRSIEEKESYKWLKSYQAVNMAQQFAPDTQFISVGDREADVHELFELAQNTKNGPDLLVRSLHNRTIEDENKKVWDYVAELPRSGTLNVAIPRNKDHKGRVAKLELRFSKTTLLPPKRLKNSEPITVWAILASEENPPSDVTPVEWKLFTTVATTSFEEACERVAWYAVRWGIEVYHRILKSGCKTERRQLATAKRLEACLAIDMVVAWRIQYLSMLGRDVPNMSCCVYFQEEEWKALHAYVHKTTETPQKPPTLQKMTAMLAGLGGFLGIGKDKHPGAQTLWLGIHRLFDIVEMWKLMGAALSKVERRGAMAGCG